ncbi:UNVERIFIED_CONTAM: hypothetical protein K2H54_057260 [Gekko kuhli]
MLPNKNAAVLWVLAGVTTVKYFHVLCLEVLSLLNCAQKEKDSYPLKIHLMEPLQKLMKVSPIYRDFTSISQILGKIRTILF